MVGIGHSRREGFDQLFERPSRNPLRTASRSQRDSGSRLVVWGGSSRNLFNSSAIGGEPVVGPVLGLRWVILDASLSVL